MRGAFAVMTDLVSGRDRTDIFAHSIDYATGLPELIAALRNAHTMLSAIPGIEWTRLKLEIEDALRIQQEGRS